MAEGGNLGVEGCNLDHPFSSLTGDIQQGSYRLGVAITPVYRGFAICGTGDILSVSPVRVRVDFRRFEGSHVVSVGESSGGLRGVVEDSPIKWSTHQDRLTETPPTVSMLLRLGEFWLRVGRRDGSEAYDEVVRE